jgi:hypothetical protein
MMTVLLYVSCANRRTCSKTVWAGIKNGEYPKKDFAMKKAVLTVLAAGFLAVLAGCVSYSSFVEAYMNDYTTTLLPDGTIQWAPRVKTNAAAYARRNSNTDGGAQYNRLYEEFTEQVREKILEAAWSSKEELEQLGKKVYPNPDLAGVTQRLDWLEKRLRTLPTGTKMVYGGTAPQQHDATLVAWLNNDGSLEHYIVED